MAPAAPERSYPKQGPRFAVSQGLITMLLALAVLLVACVIFAPTSVQRGTLLGMLPFAAVLVIVALGPDPGGSTGRHRPVRPGRRLVGRGHRHPRAEGRLTADCSAAVALALGVAVLAGVGNGLLIGRLGLNPIVATLGMNALLYAGVLGISGGSPRRTTDLLARHRQWPDLGRSQRRLLRGRHPCRGRDRSEVDGRRVAASRPWARTQSRLGHRYQGHSAPSRCLHLGTGALLAGRSSARRHHRATDGLPGRRPICCPRSRPSCSGARPCSAVAATSSRRPWPRSS